MREITHEEHMAMEATILYHLTLSMDEETAFKIADSKNNRGETFTEEVMDDIKTSSDWENNGHYNDDDVRLAIGRVLKNRFNIHE